MKFGLILSLFFCFSLCNCESLSTRQREFDSVKIGMLKHEVIQVAGPPVWSDRKNGQDRWVYHMIPGDRDSEQLIYFEHGKVVEKGDRKTPLLSAEEADDLKSENMKNYSHKPSVSDKKLRSLIKKEIKKAKAKEKPKEDPFEPI